MTEQSTEQNGHHFHASEQADIYLYLLMEILDSDETNQSAVSVTLMVGGGVVCGELVSHARWRGEMEEMLQGVGGPGPELVSKMLQTVGREAGPRKDDQLLSYVHLRKAKIITNYRATLESDEQMGPEFPLWRTRLADVQGWTLGRPA
jgi:hypothetical protein